MRIFINQVESETVVEDFDGAIEAINQISDVGYYLESVSVNNHVFRDDFEHNISVNFPNVDLYFFDKKNLIRHNYTRFLELINQLDELSVNFEQEVYSQYTYQLEKVHLLSDHLIEIIQVIRQMTNLKQIESTFKTTQFEDVFSLFVKKIEVYDLIRATDYLRHDLKQAILIAKDKFQIEELDL